MTVTGVAFSVTVASAVYASAQYGPRLLTNFLADRSNQVTLGAFNGTTIYTLLLLHRLGDPAPQLAMHGAAVLALLSFGVFIYFVHHVPESMKAGNVAAGIGRRLVGQLRGLLAQPPEPCMVEPERARQDGDRLFATVTGYVRAIDEPAILRLLDGSACEVQMLVSAGDFVWEGAPIAVWLGEGAPPELSGLVRIGPTRTDFQDPRFGANELVEIAARALSPGVNDPFTAIACMNWLAAAYSVLLTGPLRSGVHRDENGARLTLRLHGPAEYAEVCLGQLVPYVARDALCSARLHGILTELLRNARGEPQLRLEQIRERLVQARPGLLREIREIRLP